MTEVVVHKQGGTIINMDVFKEAFLKMKDGEVLITMNDRRKRSLPQNDYYWGGVVPMVRAALYDIGFDEVQTNADAHEMMKKHFIPIAFTNKKTGEVMKIAGKSSKLTVTQFEEYIERICKWASEYLGIVIPSPNQHLCEFQEKVEEWC